MKKLILHLNRFAALALLLVAMLVGTGCPNPTDPEPDPCDPPQMVQLVAIGSNTATLTWQVPSGVSTELTVTPQPNPPGPFTVTGNTIALTGLLPDTDYKVSLRSLCADGGTSEPVTISFRTNGIIITEIIVQKEPPAGTDGLCQPSPMEVLNQATPINWSTAHASELLKIGNGTTKVFIVKSSTTGPLTFTVLRNGSALCGEVASNAPTSLTTSGGTTILTGTGYTIELTAASAKMIVASSVVGTYSMYR